MPTCYLHVGGHKSGSTAIQAFLAKRRGALRAAGLLAPISGAAPNGSHGPLCRALWGHRGAPGMGDIETRLDGEIRRHAELNLIVSHEGLEGHLREDEPSPVAEFFKRKGFELAFVLYVRNQPQRLNSAYGQVTKALALNEEIEDHIGRYLIGGSLLYFRRVRLATLHGARLIARPFNAKVITSGVVADLLDALDLPVGLAGNGSFRANEAATPAVVAAARTIMDRLHDARVTLDQRQRAMAAKHLGGLSAGGAKFRGISHRLASLVYRHFDGDNEHFARQAWGRAWSDVFASELQERVDCNTIDRSDEGSPGHVEYRRLVEEAWPEIERIVLQERAPEALRRPSQPRNAATGLSRFYIDKPSVL